MVRRQAPAADRAALDHFHWVGIVEAEFDYVYWTLRRFGASALDAEDLCQEVFLAMWRRRASYDPQRPLRPWLAGIAYRVKLEHRRRGARELAIGFVDQTDEAPLPDERLEREGAQALVLKALSRIPERQRTVLVLHDIDGLPMRDIAEMLSVPLFTLYTRLRTARRSFAKEVRRAQMLSTATLAAGALLAGERKVPAAPARARRRVTHRLGALFATGTVRPAPPPAGPLPAATGALLGGAGLAALALVLVLTHGRDVAPAPRPLAANEGLVGSWRFDEPAGSTTARGLGEACTLHKLDPGHAWTSAPHGGALALDGHGWVECAATPALASLREEITIAAWVTRSALVPHYHAVVARQKGTGRLDDFMFGFADGKLLFTSHVWRGQLTRPLPADLPAWFHVAVTRQRDGTTVLYAQGRELGRARTGPGVLDSQPNPLVLGGSVDSVDPGRIQSHYEGAVDDLLIYGRALPAAEIAALAAR